MKQKLGAGLGCEAEGRWPSRRDMSERDTLEIESNGSVRWRHGHAGAGASTYTISWAVTLCR